jgi:hypothetical protein
VADAAATASRSTGVARVRGPWIDALAALAGLAVLAAWMHPAAARPLTWDEVDYVVAARAGTWANLSDQGAMGPLTFLRFALAKAGRGDAQAVASAAGYVEEESVLSLRHWHPPGGLLLLPAAITAAGPERGARATQLGWVLTLALLTLAVLREVAPDRPALRASALLVVLLDPLTRGAVLEAHMHVAVAAAFLLPLWVWLRATRDPLDARPLGDARERMLAGTPPAPMAGRPGAVVLGLALGTLSAFAVVGPLWTALWIGALLAHGDARAWLGRDWGWVWMLLGALAALLVLWPAAFTRASLLQTYALRLYAVLFLGGREWSSAAVALLGFLRRSPALAIYAGLAVAALGRGLLGGRRDALAGGAAAVAFLVVILPFAIIDRYLLPLLALAAVCGVSLATPGDPERSYPAAEEIEAARAVSSGPGPGGPGARRWAPWGALAAIVASWALAPGFAYPDPAVSDVLRAEYALVDAIATDGDEVLAEGGHIFRFYAGAGAARVRPILVDYDGRRLLLRDGVRYDTVSPERRAWIVLQQRPAGEPEIFARLGMRCARADLPTHAHFACGGVDGSSAAAGLGIGPPGGPGASAPAAPADTARSAPRPPPR